MRKVCEDNVEEGELIEQLLLLQKASLLCKDVEA